MDALVDSLIQLLITWGLPGMFLSALLAGTVIPFSSELVMVGLIQIGVPAVACLFAAALGNTVGGMTCYYIGRLGKTEWMERYFGLKPEKIKHVMRFLQGKGALMAFFAFLPIVGEAIAVALGFMRSRLLLTTLAMFAGKTARYAFILYLMELTVG